MNVFLDTNVVLRAFRTNETPSKMLVSLVHDGTCRRGKVSVTIVAPVITELLLTSEKHEPYARETQSLLDRVRQARSATEARESSALDALRDGLDRAFTAYEAARADHYRQALTADAVLAKHAVFPPMPAGLLTSAYEIEEKLTAQAADAVGRRDLLILAAVQRNFAPGDVFVTDDRRLRSAASLIGLLAEASEHFANASP